MATFDKQTSADQRQALGEIVGHVFPVKWKSFQTAEGDIDTWTFDKDQAHATLNAGKTAEIKLKRFPGMTNEPAVLTNVKYWGTPRNDGFRKTLRRRRGLRWATEGFRHMVHECAGEIRRMSCTDSDGC